MSVYPNTDQDYDQLDTEIIICIADNIIGHRNLKIFSPRSIIRSIKIVVYMPENAVHKLFIARYSYSLIDDCL